MTNKYKSEYRKTISKYNGNCSDCGIKIISNITQNIICRFVLGLWLGMLCLDCGSKHKIKIERK